MTTITPIRKAPDRPDELSERDMRIDLAACYRLIAHFGMDDLVYSHITARVPGPRNLYLLNPYGLMYSEITASSLVKVDDDGNPAEPTDYPVNRPGLRRHPRCRASGPSRRRLRAALSLARRDRRIVSRGRPSAPHAGSASVLTTGSPTTPTRAWPFDDEQGARLVADLGDKQVMLMRNHGQLTAGRTVAEAFSLAYFPRGGLPPPARDHAIRRADDPDVG